MSSVSLKFPWGGSQGSRETALPKTEAYNSELSTTGLVSLGLLSDVSVRHPWEDKLQELILLDISKWESLSRVPVLGEQLR